MVISFSSQLPWWLNDSSSVRCAYRCVVSTWMNGHFSLLCTAHRCFSLHHTLPLCLCGKLGLFLSSSFTGNRVSETTAILEWRSPKLLPLSSEPLCMLVLVVVLGCAAGGRLSSVDIFKLAMNLFLLVHLVLFLGLLQCSLSVAVSNCFYGHRLTLLWPRFCSMPLKWRISFWICEKKSVCVW